MDEDLPQSLPPLVVIPRLESRVWGGSQLAPWLQLTHAPKPLAEVWLVYADNRVADGGFAGKTLAELSQTYGADLLGSANVARTGTQFPLLAKFLDAAEHLSVQVHPDDEYAHSVEAESGFSGKNEAWYILRTAPNAQLVHGWARATSREECEQALTNGTIMDLVRYIPAEAHTTVHVPAGTIHAINAGVMLFEIQQTSDLTYRLYDYGRPREMHLERGLDVLNYEHTPPATVEPRQLSDQRFMLDECAYFVMERWDLAVPESEITKPTSLEIFTVIDGDVGLSTAHGTRLIRHGQAVILPANLGSYTFSPVDRATVLRCFVPDQNIEHRA